MSILLYDCEIGLYYAGPHHWASDCNKAFDLGSVAAAAALIRSQKLAHITIVLGDQGTSISYATSSDAPKPRSSHWAFQQNSASRGSRAPPAQESPIHSLSER